MNLSVQQTIGEEENEDEESEEPQKPQRFSSNKEKNPEQKAKPKISVIKLEEARRRTTRAFIRQINREKDEDNLVEDDRKNS